jgi:SNF2 family DNA or RNA helicase
MKKNKPNEIRQIRRKIRAIVLRRTKKQVLKELPQKTETLLKLPFEKTQLNIYRDIALAWNQKVQQQILSVGEKRSQLTMLTALLRLRQVCSDPAGIPDVEYLKEPPKVTTLIDMIQEITDSGESALVFTQFMGTLNRIEGALRRENIPVNLIHGKFNRKKREESLRAFDQEEKGSVLLMTLKTGGVGLNLTKASYVFHIEPWWNPAVENQAIDRAHRLGQTRPVTVYRYIMQESVEEKVEKLKTRKAATFSAVFDALERKPEDAKPVQAEVLTADAVVKEKPKAAEQPYLSQDDFMYLLND